MLNLEATEKLLKTLTVAQVASRLDMTSDQLNYRLKMAGSDVVGIKDDYAREVLTELSGKHTYKEMSRITGFSIRKIKRYAKMFVVTSRMKPRGSTCK